MTQDNLFNKSLPPPTLCNQNYVDKNHYRLIDGADGFDAVLKKWEKGECIYDVFYFHHGRISPTSLINSAWEKGIIVKVEDYANSIKTIELLKHVRMPF